MERAALDEGSVFLEGKRFLVNKKKRPVTRDKIFNTQSTRELSRAISVLSRSKSRFNLLKRSQAETALGTRLLSRP